MSENNGICPKCGNYEQIGGHACIVPSVATNSTAPTMSEKAATPATDEQVEEIQLSYAHFNKIEIEDLAALCIRINSDRARIDALQAENERLRGLCGETHQHLKNILTTPGTNITGSCYVCHDLLVRLDRASKETI